MCVFQQKMCLQLFTTILLSFFLHSSGFLISKALTYLRQHDLFMESFSPGFPRPQNVPGNLYVDGTCIDCDVCRWMSPSTFLRKGLQSAVVSQPETNSEKLAAYGAMVCCPVGSIRTHTPDPLVKFALDAFPANVELKFHRYLICLCIISNRLMQSTFLE
jgi:hypothetical protein